MLRNWPPGGQNAVCFLKAAHALETCASSPNRPESKQIEKYGHIVTGQLAQKLAARWPKTCSALRKTNKARQLSIALNQNKRKILAI